MSALRRRAGRLARGAAIAPIAVYQRTISPALGQRCKYEPTCSRYAVDAIRRYGILRGLVLAGWRLLRCNPFSYGGYDPVHAQRVFATRERAAAEAPGKSAGAVAAERAPSSAAGT
jgi:uncharacterized protein